MTRNDKRNQKPARENRGPDFIAFHVSGKEEKKFWTRIGAAWKHEDGEGYTLNLELVPVNDGRIVLRLPKEDNKEGEGA